MVEIANNTEMESIETFMTKITKRPKNKQIEKIKLITIGDCNVGKSCIIRRFGKDFYSRRYSTPTISIERTYVNVTLAGKPA
jgi:GTPase SAR1 family protein